MESSEAHLKCLCTKACSVRKKQDELEVWSVPRAITSLLLEMLGGMNPTMGVLGWRATGWGGEVDKCHCKGEV